MIDPYHLTRHVICPAIDSVGLYSAEAAVLLLGTAAVESHCGTYLKQIGGGPALGVFQMEPATHDDIIANFLAYRAGLMRAVGATVLRTSAAEMTGNLTYAAIMARLHYRRVPEPLPNRHLVKAQGEYWKQHYNTPEGAGSVRKYIDAMMPVVATANDAIDDFEKEVR